MSYESNSNKIHHLEGVKTAISKIEIPNIKDSAEKHQSSFRNRKPPDLFVNIEGMNPYWESAFSGPASMEGLDCGSERGSNSSTSPICTARGLSVTNKFECDFTVDSTEDESDNVIVDGDGFLDSNVFINASIQLLQKQSDMRRRIRSIWHLVKKLRKLNQINDEAVQQMRTELLNTLKDLEIEDQISNKGEQTGYLNLLTFIGSAGTREIGSSYSGSPSISPRSKHKLGSNSAGSNGSLPHQRCWCVLNPEKGILEIYYRIPEESDLTKSSDHCSKSITDQPSNAQKTSSVNINIFSRLKLSSSLSWLIPGESLEKNVIRIDLHECHCYEIHSKYGSNRFQLRVPSSEGYVFEASSAEEQQAWIHKLQEVCNSKLLDMQQSLSSAASRFAFRSAMELPVIIPITWLQRNIQRNEKGAMARRSSKFLPLLQITRDLERDRMNIDGELICGTEGIERVLNILVSRFHSYFIQRQHKNTGKINNSAPTSPTSKLTKCLEAKSLAFAERVLRGSTRTQTGGDIYDAISMLFKNPLITVCPISQDAQPVYLSLDVTHAPLRVNVEVSMQFKLTPLNGKEPQELESCGLEAVEEFEWAKVEGTLHRCFTFGRISEPGSVRIDWIRESS